MPHLPKDKELAVKVLDNASSLDKLRAERGWLGGIWGASSHVPNNMAAFTIVILVITGIAYTIIKKDMTTDDKALSVKDLWTLITPLITLAIGYLFGDKKKNEV